MIVLHVDFGMGLGEKQCKRQSAERGGGDCGFRIADCGLDGERRLTWTEGGKEGYSSVVNGLGFVRLRETMPWLTGGLR